MNNRLAVLRAERQWSQADLGARLDVSRQAVNHNVTGKNDPSLRLACKIAGLFGPFDDADRARVEVLPEAGIQPFRAVLESIEIKMI